MRQIDVLLILQHLCIFIYFAVFIFCILILISSYTGYRIRDFFSPARWRSVFIWLLKKQLHKMGETNTYLTRGQLIQYGYRVAHCFECIKAGQCVHCGCDAEGRMNSATDSCSAGKWGMMITEEQLDEYLNHPETKLQLKVIEE